jgi:CTP synthase
VQTRDENSDLGGTMRLGSQQCRLLQDTLAFSVYQKDVITERHRHRYEFNNQYIERLEAGGMRFSGKSIDGRLVEVIEIPDHPWFIACQFHPEFTSTPRRGHPLFSGFVQAAFENRR